MPCSTLGNNRFVWFYCAYNDAFKLIVYAKWNGWVHSSKKASVCRSHKSLLHELHSLLRVMWSGKMTTVVSPHSMLYTVWNNIPFFRGYSQQDAQEFLSYDVSLCIFSFVLVKIPISHLRIAFFLHHKRGLPYWTKSHVISANNHTFCAMLKATCMIVHQELWY